MAEETWVPEGGGEEDASYEALHPGIYDVIVESVEAGYGKGSGVPYVTWVFVVTNEVSEGAKLFHRTSMSDQAKAFPGDGFYAVLDRLRLSDALAGKTMDFEEMVSVLADEGVGREARVNVTRYQYEGKWRNDVDNFWAADDEKAPPHRVFPVKDEDAAPAADIGQGAAGAQPPH